jgi:hypothetical protein
MKTMKVLMVFAMLLVNAAATNELKPGLDKSGTHGDKAEYHDSQRIDIPHVANHGSLEAEKRSFEAGVPKQELGDEGPFHFPAISSGHVLHIRLYAPPLKSTQVVARKSAVASRHGRRASIGGWVRPKKSERPAGNL